MTIHVLSLYGIDFVCTVFLSALYSVTKVTCSTQIGIMVIALESIVPYIGGSVSYVKSSGTLTCLKSFRSAFIFSHWIIISYVV